MTTSYAPETSVIEPDTAATGRGHGATGRVIPIALRPPRGDLADDAGLDSLGAGGRTAPDRTGPDLPGPDRTAHERPFPAPDGTPMRPRLTDAVPTRAWYDRTAVRGHRGARRAPSHRRYLIRAMLRCALYIGPLGVVVAAADPLSRVPWPVPTVIMLLGWSAAQALTAVGLPLAGRAGRTAAARQVGGGFAAVAGGWFALIWVAPAALLGPERLLAAVLAVGGLATLATVAGALVTRSEAAVIRWSLPVWLLAAITIAGAWPPHVPGYALLGLAIAAATVRAFRPALVRHARRRPPLTRAELRRGLCYGIIGAAQAGCVALLWRTGPPGATLPAVLPLLAAVPLLAALVAWHTGQVGAGPDGTGGDRAYAGHLRWVTVVTVAGLLPPLAIGLALAAAAYRLPYGLSHAPGARDLVLSLAGGTLLGGVLAVTLLLAARGRTATAATLAAAAPLLTSAAHALPASVAPPLTSDLLPTAVAILAATLLVGLPAVAHTALDHRRTS